jgi:hypothetical protein
MYEGQAIRVTELEARLESTFLAQAGAKMGSLQRVVRRWYHRELAPLIETWRLRGCRQLSTSAQRHLQDVTESQEHKLKVAQREVEVAQREVEVAQRDVEALFVKLDECAAELQKREAAMAENELLREEVALLSSQEGGL